MLITFAPLWLTLLAAEPTAVAAAATAPVEPTPIVEGQRQRHVPGPLKRGIHELEDPSGWPTEPPPAIGPVDAERFDAAVESLCGEVAPAAGLPEVARVDLGGVRLAVVHETGDAKGREQRCDALYPDADVLVFGHSHIPWDSVTPGGLRLLNPGSPTDRRRQPFCTYQTAEIRGGELVDVELHELPPRG